MNLARGLILEGVKVGIAAWVTFWLGPIISEHLPDIWPLAVHLGTALVSAVLLEVIYLLVAGRPVLEVVWSIPGAAEPLSELKVVINEFVRESEVFRLEARLLRSSGLGHLVLAKALERGLRVEVSVPHAPLRVIADDSNFLAAGDEPVVSSKRPCAIVMQLRAPAVKKSWAVAKITFTSPKDAFDQHFELRHVSTADTKFGWACAKVIKVSCLASSVHLSGK